MWDLWWTKLLGARFLRVLRFFLPLIPPTAPHSTSSIIRRWYNRLNSDRRTKWTQSHSTSRNESSYSCSLPLPRYSRSRICCSVNVIKQLCWLSLAVWSVFVKMLWTGISRYFSSGTGVGSVDLYISSHWNSPALISMLIMLPWHAMPSGCGDGDDLQLWRAPANILIVKLTWDLERIMSVVT
jgi:hypothetical protein